MLVRCPSYHKHVVTFLRVPEGYELALSRLYVEYCGTLDSDIPNVPHGNARVNDVPYERKPAVLDIAKRRLPQETVKDVYGDLCHGNDEDKRPRDCKQIRNAKYNLDKARRVGAVVPNANVADDLMHVMLPKYIMVSCSFVYSLLLSSRFCDRLKKVALCKK